MNTTRTGSHMQALGLSGKTMTAPPKPRVRPAKAEDAPALMSLFQRHHRASHWQGRIEFDSASARSVLDGFLASDSARILVDEGEDGITGFIAVLVVPHYFNRAVLSAQELVFYDENPHGAQPLVDAAIAWAEGSGAAIFQLGSQDGSRNEAIRRLYARRDFTPFSTSYVKELNHGR